MAATEELPPWEVLDGAFLPEENGWMEALLDDDIVQNGPCARVAPLPDGVTLAVAVSALHGYTMSRAHLSEWAALAQDPASRFSAFVYLEDDIELTTAALRAWDTDEGRLVASGASGAGFHRGFFRYELSSADDGGQRADGRYVVDERRTRWWNNGSCAAAATE